MGRFLLIALAVALCAATVMAQSGPELLLQGRFGGSVNEQTGVGSLPVLFSWPASSVYASFSSESVAVTLTNLHPTVAFSAYTRFAFFIDQQQVAVESTDPQNMVINWSMSGLSAGSHNLTITKISEASYGQATLDSITLGANGTFMPPMLPAAFQSGRRIQFIGDSYTVGFANTGGTSMCNRTACSPVTGLCNPELDSQNAAIAWGPLTAAHYDADFQVIAWSGAEVVTPDLAASLGAEGIPFWEGEEIFPLDSQIWTRQVEADNSSMVANFSSWVPQVVVMAGGTNDFHSLPAPDLDEWRSSFIDFINQVNMEYNTPEIILQVFPWEVQFEGVLTFNQTTVYLQYMAALFTEVQAEGLDNVHFLQLNALTMDLSDWCASHPSAAADQNISEQLIAFMDAILPNWATATYPLAVQV